MTRDSRALRWDRTLALLDFEAVHALGVPRSVLPLCSPAPVLCNFPPMVLDYLISPLNGAIRVKSRDHRSGFLTKSPKKTPR